MPLFIAPLIVFTALFFWAAPLRASSESVVSGAPGTEVRVLVQRPSPAAGPQHAPSSTPQGEAKGAQAPPLQKEQRLGVAWLPLLQRLAADGISGPDIDAYFLAFGPAPTQDPMGRKVRELYTSKFLKPPPDPNAPKVPRPTLYKNVVTPENVAQCRAFLETHAATMALAELRYGVPKEIAVALMFVETRLGTVLGQENALYTLASMAVSRSPEDIPLWLEKLPGYEEHLAWMADLMPKRADWAYKELRALLAFVRAQGLDPFAMPGSIYGAIGICQFMPSNLSVYGADGNGDGVVDLFVVPDAVASLSNYLVRHGWKAGIPREKQHTVLKTYNRIDIYANTILALADAIRGVELPLPKPAPPVRKKAAPAR